MTAPVPRSVVEAFYEAYNSRDPARIASFLDDDVEWMITGPVDLLQYCGERRGKLAVFQLFARIVPEVLRVTRFDTEAMLIDGDRAASFSRISGVQPGTGRIISYRCAQFLRFRDSLLVSFRSIIDSFDAAEQTLGHPLEFVAEGFGAEFIDGRNVIAV